MNIICIVGQIASGKTSLANDLSIIIGCPRYSTSDYLKSVARNLGYTIINREVLQKVGQKSIEEGWDVFCKKFIASIDFNNNQTIIIDGIRHKEFYLNFKELLLPSRCLLFYLDVNDETIKEHLRKRGENDINYSHMAEGNLHELKLISDYRINEENKPKSEVVSEILSFVSKNH